MEKKRQPVKKVDVTRPSRKINHSENSAKRSPDYPKLLEKNLRTEIVDKLDDIFKSGKLKFVELDESVFVALNQCPTEVASAVLDQFKEANYTRKSIKSALLCTMMEVQNLKQFITPPNSTDSNSSEESGEAILSDRNDESYNVGRNAKLNPYASEFFPSSASEGGSTDDFENYVGNQAGHREETNGWLPDSPDSSEFDFGSRNQRRKQYRTARNVPYQYPAPIQYVAPYQFAAPPTHVPPSQQPGPVQIAVPSQYMGSYQHIGTSASSPQTPEVHVFLSNYYLG